ncbi:response regulator transcription factor [Streptomyces marincola]|uniref:response regulator transcription factor n=1 Tax=Streptomyces marincola TaxID=2878388 RepID=UPI001CF3A3DD|nr:response regulator transcription factor [Streptomyces marincola]UCM87090.1 response regulator transcription factor [Streptomyces marincola]
MDTATTETTHTHPDELPPWSWRTEHATWRILVVESDQAAAEELTHGLRHNGHAVTRVGTGCEAVRECTEVDVVLLKLELPDFDGLAVCRGIRSVSDVPVIAVTERGSELDCVLGLQAGADDYLVQPYGLRELIARIDAVMRRARSVPAAESVICRGALKVDATTRQVTVNGVEVDLTRKEFDLLYLLASHPDTVIPRKQLMQKVWDGSWSRRTVDTHVSGLRNKLGSSDWIITVRGVGFRLGHA